MPAPLLASPSDVDCDAAEKIRRRRYSTAYRRFSRSLTPKVRAKINGSAEPAWQTTRTFALPINAEHPAFRSEDPDPVLDELEELAKLKGALPTIALGVHDRIGALGGIIALDQFRIGIARICEAKNSRLEGHLVSLAIGLNLRGNANGYAIAEHFGLTPQAVHEALGETCSALGMPKPLAKVNKARYSVTQYRHNLRKSS